MELGLIIFAIFFLIGFIWLEKKISKKRELKALQKRLQNPRKQQPLKMQTPKRQHKYSGIIKKMAHYRRNIEKLAHKHQGNIHAQRLEKIIHSFDEWEAHVEWLIKRLLEFESDKNIKHDQAILPKKIKEAQIKWYNEPDERLRDEIKETLDSYLKQKKQLDNVIFLMEKTRLDLEEFVAGIGTIYSQLKTVEATDIRSNRARRLMHEIDEERLELDDLLDSLDELYRG